VWMILSVLTLSVTRVLASIPGDFTPGGPGHHSFPGLVQLSYPPALPTRSLRWRSDGGGVGVPTQLGGSGGQRLRPDLLSLSATLVPSLPLAPIVSFGLSGGVMRQTPHLYDENLPVKEQARGRQCVDLGEVSRYPLDSGLSSSVCSQNVLRYWRLEELQQYSLHSFPKFLWNSHLVLTLRQTGDTQAGKARLQDFRVTMECISPHAGQYGLPVSGAGFPGEWGPHTGQRGWFPGTGGPHRLSERLRLRQHPLTTLKTLAG
jgi:hypothetical protein